MSKNQVAIVMGSESDLKVMKDAAETLEYFGIKYEITILSAHRTPERMFEYASKAMENGIQVIIAGAGGSAHLPGMISSLTLIPVIGVPIKSSSLEGLDSLLSIVQMPPGVPVATMAINGSKNAAILACQILSINNNSLLERLEKYKIELKNKVISTANRLQNTGWREYLS
ncbi:MAG TPA: 5-(carboxyamino)imidazole ribonucleotide mutase [Nitrososphaeraceae archaeon]|nr:5-(carboxyamino)imidazole ribonucleotide mutase [Nitrososphaeraceae archaeon]